MIEGTSKGPGWAFWPAGHGAGWDVHKPQRKVWLEHLALVPESSSELLRAARRFQELGSLHSHGKSGIFWFNPSQGRPFGEQAVDEDSPGSLFLTGLLLLSFYVLPWT